MIYALTIDGNRSARLIRANDVSALVRVAARILGEEILSVSGEVRYIMKTKNHRAVARPIG